MKSVTNCVVALLVLVVVAAPALAKDVCVGTASVTLVFRKVQRLKPGRAISLRGVYLSGLGASPFEGSAMMLTDGATVKVGIFVHSMTGGPNNFTMEWTTTIAYTGTAQFDADGDFQSDGSLTLATVDCTTVAIP